MSKEREASKAEEIREIKEYVDKGGRKVIVFAPVYNRGKQQDLFKGLVVIQVAGNGPQPEQATLEFPFPKGIKTIKKAFETYDNEAENFIKKLEKQQREKANEKKIIAPPPNLQILGADGKVAV